MQTIFRPNFNDFNVILELNTTKLNRRCETIDWQPKKSLKLRLYEKKPEEVMPIVMFDCAYLYLKELKVNFPHFFQYLWDWLHR